jgi:hypothetical protein
MEYLIALAAAALLALSFTHRESARRSRNDSSRAGLFCITGTLAHLGGAALLGLSAGPLAGIIALLGIPVGGAVIYSLLGALSARQRRPRGNGSRLDVPSPRAARVR